MSDYDPANYKLVEDIGTVGDDKSVLHVGIWQYADYPAKIKVQRMGKRKGETYCSPVKGMSAEEAAGVAELLLAAVKLL